MYKKCRAIKRSVPAAIALMVFSLLAVAFIPLQSAQAGGAPYTQLWLGPAAQNVSQNATFKMAVNLTTFNQAVDTVSVAMTYPASRLSCVGVTSTPDFTFTPQPDTCSGGNILIQRGRSGNQSASGMVAIVTFRALSIGSAHVAISPSSQALSGGNPVAFSTVESDYQVIGGSMTYASQYAGQSAYPSIIQGQTATSFLSFKNTGNQAWYDDTTASSNVANPLHLASSRPINRFSLVGTAWGGGQNRPALQLATVYEADGITAAGDPHIVYPGQIAKFSIIFFGPTNLQPQTFREFFQPIIEGATTMNDPGTFLDVTLVAPVYASQYAGQSAYPQVARGQTTPAFLTYKNTGNQPWYDDTSAAANQARAVHLATSRPINRFSLVGTAWGGGQNRPALQFGTVYEADGTTPATNQRIVQPGQIAKFNITFFGPTNLQPQTFREFFQPIVEGGTTMNDPGTFLDVTLTP